jgi:hemolysin D
MLSPRRNARPEPPIDSLIRIFESEKGELNEERVPRHVRSTLLVLAAMLVLLFLGTTLFQIDRVVTSSFGQVVTIDPTIVLQPLDISIVKSLKVQEGDRVKQGQLLAELDPTFAAADVNSLRLQLSSLEAEIARCEDELADKPYDYVPDDALGNTVYASLQASLYLQRKTQHDSQVHAYDEQIAEAAATIGKVKNDEKRYGDREKLAQELEGMRSQLIAKEDDSKLNLLLATDAKTEMLRNIESNQNLEIATQHQLESVTATRDAFIKQWDAQTSQELVKARNDRDNTKQLLEKALRHQDVVRLEAPADAIVLRVAKISVGSVLEEGQFFMELARLDSPMEAEIYVEPLNVGFLRPGDDTAVKLDAFHFVEHGWAEGKLRWVSQGTFVIPQPAAGGTVMPGTSSEGDAMTNAASEQGGAMSAPFYKARVSITKADLKNVPTDFQITPGMTLSADIHVGTRSLFWYLMRGIVRGFDEAMREP